MTQTTFVLAVTARTVLSRWLRAAAAGLVALAALEGTGIASGTAPATPIAPLVRLPFPRDDGSLTPYTYELGYSLLTLIYDTLLWRDTEGVPQPWLAQSVDRSADGLRITLALAKGATWHDGQPVTAADVAFTFDYFRKRPHPRFTPELGAVQEVQTPDPHTVVIVLRHQAPGFSDQPLADLPIIPAHLWRNLPADQAAPPGLAIGSGPYRLVRYRPGDGYRFEANPTYYRGPPVVGAIEVPIIPKPLDAIQALRRRKVDALPLSLPNKYEKLAEGLGIRRLQGPSYLGTVLLLNLREPPFDQQAVRQAVARSLDLQHVANAIGNAVPATNGYLHPMSPWSSHEALHVFDVGAARATLAALHLPQLDVLAPDSDPVKLEAAHQVASALQRVGYPAQPKVLSTADLSKSVGADGSAPTFHAAIWVSPPMASYDPDFLARAFGSGSGDTTLNLAGYHSTTFDGLGEQIATTAELAARHTAVANALRQLSADVPVVPLFFANGDYRYRRAAYDGWNLVKGGGILDKRSFLEPQRRSSPEADPPPASSPPDRSSTSWIAAALVAAGLVGMAVLVYYRRR